MTKQERSVERINDSFARISSARKMLSAKDSSARNVVSAMSRLIHDTETADFTLICGKKKWKVHSAILAVRSPFFKAAIANNMVEKEEMKMEIKDLDPEGMKQVINYMYGMPIDKTHFSSLLEASERFQMDDLKEDLIVIGIKMISKDNAVEMGKLGEVYNIEQFLQKSSELIVKEAIEMKEEDISPKLAVRILNIYKDTMKKCFEKESKVRTLRSKSCNCKKSLKRSHRST